jgi:translocation and assembly module TamA
MNDARRVAGVLRRALGAALLAALSGCAALGIGGKPDAEAPAAAASAASGPAAQPTYRLDVVAPNGLKTLLVTYLDLSRFQSATGDNGVTPSELERLVRAAPAQARSLLETEGYFSAEVSVEREAGTPPVVRLKVEPGPRTRVASVSLQERGPLQSAAERGDAAAQAIERQLAEAWPLKAGQPWRQPAWSAAKVETLARLHAAGYPAATQAESRAEIDAPSHSARLELLLDSGPLFHLGPIRVEGIERYDASAVRNVAEFGPGTPYTEKRLLDFQDRIGKTGLFETASVEIDRDPAHADAAPVTVRVRELPLQQVTFGVGYSANTGQRASVEHLYRRVFGQLWSAKSKLEWGRDLKSAETELTSYPKPSNYRNLVAAGIEQLTTNDEVRDSAHLRVGRSRESPDVDRLYYFELTRAKLFSAGLLEPQVRDAAWFNYQWTFRHLDSVLLPTKGYSASLQLGGGYARANDADNGPFGRGDARLTLYQPFGKWFGQARFEAAQVFAADAIGVPDTLLFRAGGADSVHGYAYRSLGPIDNVGAVMSGRVMATGGVELAHPIAQRYPAFLWAVFADAGNAADRWNELRPVVGYGTGLRWRSPVGPVRIDLSYGRAVHHFRLDLSVGVTF